MKKAPKVHYDPEAKILSIRLSNKKSVDSDLQGHVVLDYDAGGALVNVDIMNVSLGEFRKKAVLRPFSQRLSQA